MNQPELCNEGKVSCYKKQQEPSIWLELTTDRLGGRRTYHCDIQRFRLGTNQTERP